MTSRRNFVIGVGAVLMGSGTFFGSGAFSLASASRPDGWVPIESQTPPSVGIENSVGMVDGTDDEGTGETGDDETGDDETGNGDDGGDDTDGDDDTDGNDTDGESGDSGDGSDDTGDGTGDDGGSGEQGAGGDDGAAGTTDGGEGTTDGGETDDDDDGGHGGQNSLLLRASGPGVLNSTHVRTDGNGHLDGIVLNNLNTRAMTYIGQTSDGQFPNPNVDEVAFVVRNDGDATVDLSVEVEGQAPEILDFPAHVDAPQVPGTRQVELTGDTAEKFGPGAQAFVVIEADTMAVADVPENAIQRITVVAEPR